MTIDRTKVKQRRHANTAASYAMSAEPAPAPSVKPAINPLTGRPFVDVPGLPANASFFQRVRARLPSKRWATFWAVLFAAGGYVKYDNWQIKKIQEELKERVRELSDRPWVPTERVEKVTVVVGVPVANVSAGNPRDAFREFVKPVLDAAALPYTLVESKKPPFLQNEIRRRVHSLSKPPAPKDPEAPPLPEEDLPFDKGILCIGRAAWRETLLGLQDGMCSPPLTAEEERIEKEWWAWKEKGDRNDGFNKDPEPIRPSRLPVAEANAAKAPEIPPIGFVPYRNNPGFVRFPTRLYYFFNRRDLAREYGEATLAVCFGQSRPFTQTDEYKGWEVEEFRRPKTKEWENTDREIGILEGVQRRLRVFDLEGSNGAVGARKE